MLLFSLPYTVVLLLAGVTAAASDEKQNDPCTIASTNGDFFDLRPLAVLPVAEGKKPTKNQRTESWHARGYDYKSNFTLNICAPVTESLNYVQGVHKALWKNVSAYYEVGSKQFSLG
jgi:cation-dependent mannose-6-phosphate receptor